jgi:DNA-binding transcriptional LysR family regulator
LAKKDVIDWLELAEEPVVVNIVNGTTQPDSWPAENRPTQVVTCGNYDEWLQLVATGRGIGALPRSAARTGTHPGVTFVPLIGAPPVSVRLCHRPRLSNPLVRQFVDHAVTAAGRAPGPTTRSRAAAGVPPPG